jgi:gluconolactonase
VPNGIALSPDEKTLYVVSNGSGYVRAFPVNSDGSTGKGEDIITTLDGPDGMSVDCAGNLYVTEHSEGDVVVFDKTGKELGRIVGGSGGDNPPMARVTNVAFGGSDGKTLYITTGTRLYSLKVGVPGLPY